jgi:ATP-dependent Clp protease ATP-binding subunit ClpX
LPDDDVAKPVAKRVRKKTQIVTPAPIAFRRPEEYDLALVLVVKQEELKTKLKSAFSQYTLFCNDRKAGRPIVMIYGESGSGKTFTVELLAEASGLPLTIASAGSLSPPGYKGTTVQDLLARHYLNYHTDFGVIFVDEINKWCRMALTQGQASGANSEDIGNGTRSQHEMLRYVEHETINFTDLGRDIDEMQHVNFDTRNLLWIFAGAFIGLPNLIRRRLRNVHLTDEDVWGHALPQDFINYGMVEELAKRVQTWGWTLPLTAMDLVRILEEQQKPKWAARFAAIGCELEIHPAAINLVAMRAWEEHVGARGSISLLARSMDDLYDQVSRRHIPRLVVDHNMIETGRIELDVDDEGAA